MELGNKFTGTSGGRNRTLKIAFLTVMAAVKQVGETGSGSWGVSPEEIVVPEGVWGLAHGVSDIEGNHIKWGQNRVLSQGTASLRAPVAVDRQGTGEEKELNLHVLSSSPRGRGAHAQS